MGWHAGGWNRGGACGVVLPVNTAWEYNYKLGFFNI